MTNKEAKDVAFRVVALDGGAASGKSSTAKLLARRQHFLHVDTGSHYRAVTRACLDAGIPAVEGGSLDAFLAGLHLGTEINDRESLLSINGEPSANMEVLRSAEVNGNVSNFAALPSVRNAVMAYQRQQVEVARNCGFKGVVMDGRDIGTVILPEADLKVFLIADPATRQLRRSSEGATEAISDRDKTDSSRAVAPLKQAEDSVVIDNSHTSLQGVVVRIEQLLRES